MRLIQWVMGIKQNKGRTAGNCVTKFDTTSKKGTIYHKRTQSVSACTDLFQAVLKDKHLVQVKRGSALFVPLFCILHFTLILNHYHEAVVL